MRRSLLLVLFVALSSFGCRQDMHDQPRVEIYESSEMFPDGQGSRVPPRGTISRGSLYEENLLTTGKLEGEDATVYPFPITRQVLQRGRERFNIYCSPCHGRTGEGLGIIVRRGMRQPPSFFEERLLVARPGYFFDVITNGFGAMYSYASRISVRDRWAIVAYVQTLQFSRQVPVSELSQVEREQLEEDAN